MEGLLIAIFKMPIINIANLTEFHEIFVLSPRVLLYPGSLLYIYISSIHSITYILRMSTYVVGRF